MTQRVDSAGIVVEPDASEPNVDGPPEESRSELSPALVVAVERYRRGAPRVGALLARGAERGGFWLVPALTALVLSLWHLGRPALWRDEIFTLDRSSLSVSAILDVISAVDSVFVPYYLVMHWWIEIFGESAVALRLPSALGMTVATAIVAVLGRRLFTPVTGAVAGLVFAFVPAVSRMGQEAKPHIFATLFTALATLLLLRALDKPSWRRWLPYAVACSLIGFSHLLAFLVMAGHGVAVLALEGRRDRTLVLKWMAAAAASTVPVLVLALAGFSNRGAMAWLPLTTWRSVYELPVRMMSGSIFNLPGVGLFAGLLLALGLLGLTVNRRAGWVLGGLALVPTVLLLTGGAIEHVLHPRYLLYTLVAWSILAAATLVAQRPAIAVTLFVVLVMLGLPAQQANRQVDGHGDAGVSTVARVLAKESRPGDGLVLQPSAGTWLKLSLAYNQRVDPVARKAAHPALQPVECGAGTECRIANARLWIVCAGKRLDLRDCLAPDTAAAVRRSYGTALPTVVHEDARFTIGYLLVDPTAS